MRRTLIAIVALALPLAGCGDDPAPTIEPSADAGAQGEILGGTISDEMLPVDGLQSQSPPVAGEESDDADDDAAEGSADE